MAKPLKRIDVLLPGSSQYHVLHHFTRKLYEAFVRRGLHCRLLEYSDQLDLLLREDLPDLTIGFNGCPRDDEKRLFCDLIKVPHLACLVDPPYHYTYLLPSPYTMISCDDRMGCLLLSEMGFDRHFFMPHAVEQELNTDFHEERLFDVTLLATFIDFEVRRRLWKKKYPPLVCQALDQAIEITFSDQGISFIDAFDQALAEIHQKHGPKPVKEISFIELLTELESYVKGRDRIQLLMAIQDVPIHIFGGTSEKMSWKRYLAKKKSPIRAYGPIPFERALEVMQKSKVLLNPSLKNCDGVHERAFAGMASGALVLTNPSRYLSKHFTEGENILFYRHLQPEKTNAWVHHYLDHPDEREALVERGRKKVFEYETWDQRVSTILEFVPPLIAKIKPL